VGVGCGRFVGGADLTHRSPLPRQGRGVQSHGQLLASGSAYGTVRLWRPADLAAGSEALPDHGNAVLAIAFSPDSRTLAAGGLDGTVRLWQVGDAIGQPAVLPGHGTGISSMAFRPDGKVVAVGASRGLVQLWPLDKPDAAPIVLADTMDAIHAVAFDADGQAVAVGSGDGQVLVWTLDAERLSKLVCQVVERNLTLTEWRQFMGADTPYRPTCPDLPDGSQTETNASAAAIERE
jgi:WD40 repeat protein